VEVVRRIARKSCGLDQDSSVSLAVRRGWAGSRADRYSISVSQWCKVLVAHQQAFYGSGQLFAIKIHVLDSSQVYRYDVTMNQISQFPDMRSLQKACFNHTSMPNTATSRTSNKSKSIQTRGR
jgi:hypothetical protein